MATKIKSLLLYIVALVIVIIINLKLAVQLTPTNLKYHSTNIPTDILTVHSHSIKRQRQLRQDYM